MFKFFSSCHKFHFLAASLARNRFWQPWHRLAVLSRFSRVWLSRPHGLEPARLLCPWDFSDKHTGVGLPFPDGTDLAVLNNNNNKIRPEEPDRGGEQGGRTEGRGEVYASYKIMLRSFPVSTCWCYFPREGRTSKQRGFTHLLLRGLPTHGSTGRMSFQREETASLTKLPNSSKGHSVHGCLRNDRCSICDIHVIPNAQELPCGCS